VIGQWRYLLLYLVCGVAGAAGALYWSPNSLTVGASGAIFGVLGALLVLERRGNIATGGQVAGLIVLNLVITFAYRGSISVGGHIGGLIAGVVLMLAFVRFRQSTEFSIGAAAIVTAISLIVAYSAV
jgi:membrane associated rhomboid family serine protease